MHTDPSLNVLSRRGFLATSAAAIAASALPTESSAQPPAKYRRLKMTSGQAPLDSYREAISKMLTLPPSDPRNWYRNALVHTLDCPHGNWWFLPWHRGYIGWFEQVCRDLSGNANFALPYWDWTEYPRIPDAFYDGVLTPLNRAFVGSLDAFEKQFRTPVSDLWKSFSPTQLEQLAARKYNDTDSYKTPEDLWKAIVGSPPDFPSLFFPLAQARSLTKAAPCFDPPTRIAVSAATVRTALAAPDFTAFASGKVAQHSTSTDQGILESQPHNLVHNNIGGFMGDFLSPVDPIFFMHHANIDRLWDVWARRQKERNLPFLPAGADLDALRKEPFLFFTNAKGDPVTKTSAGDYLEIGDFGYDYQQGSVDEPTPKPSEFSMKLWAGNTPVRSSSMRHTVQTDIGVPLGLLTGTSTQNRPPLFARITLRRSVETNDVQFHVLINPPEGATHVNFDDASFAGSFSAFGRHASGGHEAAPITFTVAITNSVAQLAAAKRLGADGKIRLRVVAARRGVALAPLDLGAAEITIGAF